MDLLPEGCIASILSRTTPEDACRLSLVSKSFYSAADSDTVWDPFLPSNIHSIISQYPSLANASSKKALYLALSDHPVIIDDGEMSFQLDRKSGKKCYMLAARALSYNFDYNDSEWGWAVIPESRFPTGVVVLRQVYWLVMIGTINKISLSPNTQYGVFLVFRIDSAFEFYDYPLMLSVGIEGGHSIEKSVNLYLDSLEGEAHNQVERLPSLRVRSDEWFEIEMGEFFNSGLEDDVVHMCVEKLNGFIDGGFLIEGIEVRPKEDN